MKKTIKFFAAALAIVAASSCAKENQNISDQELVYKVFSATFDADTKTTLHTDGLTVHWTEGDKIKLLSSTSSSGNDFELLSYDKTFAEFGGETVDANSYRAVYPANALLSEGHINWWATDNQNYVLGSNESKTALAHQFAVENNFSIVKEFNAPSNFALSTSSKDGNLYFQNINAYLKFSLKMDNAAVIEVSAAKAMNTYYSLSEDAKLGGGIYITFNGNKHKKGIITNGENITFKREDGSNLLSGEDICYYIAIPAVKMEGLKLVVKDANGKVLQTLTKSSTFTAEANKIYNLGTIEAAPIPVPKVGDYFYYDGTFSTSLDGSKEVVGIIFFAGNPRENDPALPEYCTNGLAIGLKDITTPWNSSKLPDKNYANDNLAAASNGALPDGVWGYYAKTKWEKYNLSLYNTSSYGTLPSNTSGWYHGTNMEWSIILSDFNTIKNKLEAISSSDPISPGSNSWYWLPFAYSTSYGSYMYLSGTTPQYKISSYITYGYKARPIFAF